MIIGTAGHIDHGKTSLMRALTGVDTDRLPEEKRRGISIELGYAFLDAADGSRIAFVDVPGHEKLIHAMVSGATGFDHALLIVAADDGIMPQTREHAAILTLLGVRAVSVVITKIDRVDASRVDEVRADVHAVLPGFSDALCFAVSSVTGQGIEVLRAHLLGMAGAAVSSGNMSDERAVNDVRWAFRMPVDRSFSLSGIGTVVTGSVHRGEHALDADLVVNAGEKRIRVRGIHAQNRAMQHASTGQRCALNLAAVEKEVCPRGAWLVAPHLAQESMRVDAELTASFAEEKPLKSGMHVHLHVGTAEVMASLAILFSQKPDELSPGETGLVQLVFREPVSVWWGDRFLIRDASAVRTIGGGRVLDSTAPVRYRRTPQREALLRALCSSDIRHRLLEMVRQREGGASVQELDRVQGLSAGETLRLMQAPLDAGNLLSIKLDSGIWLIAADTCESLKTAAVSALQACHDKAPDELGPDMSRLRRMVAQRMDAAIWRELVQQWVKAGLMEQRGSCLLLPTHAVKLSEGDRIIAQRALPMLLEGGFDPPWVRDIATEIAQPELIVRMVFARQAAAGALYQVVKDLYYPAQTVEKLAAIARSLVASDGEVLAAAFRDATGLGRKRAIQILEFFDRVGLMRRVGDRHLLRADCRLFLPQAEGEAA